MKLGNERIKHIDPILSSNYLYNCNMYRDIENNIGQIEIPEFTKEHVKNIDDNYKQYLPRIIDISIHENNDCDCDTNLINKMTTYLELNELFIEHLDNITSMLDKVIKYKNINENTMKIQMYFQEIKPLIQDDTNNLQYVLNHLSK